MSRGVARVLLVALAFVGLAASKSLPMPPFMTACSRNEPNLNKCATIRGQEAVHGVVKGDRKYRLPVMDPMSIPLLHVDEGVLGLNLTTTNLVFRGLRDTIVKEVIWDPDNKRGVYDLLIPRVEIDTDYVVSGRILILPITGNGKGNITMVDLHVRYEFTFDLTKKDGEVYVIPTKGKMDLNPGRLYVYLDNLFNGNKLLGTEMNRFMDENWQDMVKELGPVIGEAMGQVMARVQKNVFELVSYDNAFPDTPPQFA